MSVKVNKSLIRRGATISHVASKCGVSLQTVSNVLNGRSGQASAATTERIMAAARELNYFPNAVARGLARNRMNTLGVALELFSGSVVSHEYAGPILDAALETMTGAAQDAMLFTGHLYEDAEACLPSYCDGRCDGLLLISPVNGVAIARRLLEIGVPFVLVGMNDSDEGLPWVDIDHRSAAYKMTSHLIEAGHRRIAFLRGFDAMLVSHDRQNGYERALRESGISLDERLILPGAFTIESGRERTRFLFERTDLEGPTALFCASDAIAAGAVDALHSIGLRVPEDVSVAGFDDAPSAAICDPPLTTIRQPLREMGRRSVELILDIIAQRPKTQLQVCLDSELIARKSVAPPRRYRGKMPALSVI